MMMMHKKEYHDDGDADAHNEEEYTDDDRNGVV